MNQLSDNTQNAQRNEFTTNAINYTTNQLLKDTEQIYFDMWLVVSGRVTITPEQLKRIWQNSIYYCRQINQINLIISLQPEYAEELTTQRAAVIGMAIANIEYYNTLCFFAPFKMEETANH